MGEGETGTTALHPYHSCGVRWDVGRSPLSWRGMAETAWQCTMGGSGGTARLSDMQDITDRARGRIIGRYWTR